MDGLNRWGRILFVFVTMVVLLVAFLALAVLLLALFAAGHWLWGVIF